MNVDLQAAGELLAELRNAYRILPRHLQGDVAHVLRVLAQELVATGQKWRVTTRIQTAGPEIE